MNRTRLKLLAGICLAGCVVCLWMNWRIGSTISPDERHYREMEWRLSQEADEVLSWGGARPWESDFRARLDLAVIEHDTKMHESSTYELKARALMEDRAGRADLFFYVAVGFTLIWFPGFLFLWLQPSLLLCHNCRLQDIHRVPFALRSRLQCH